MKIFSSVLDLIGNTPIIEVSKFTNQFNSMARILAKIEGFNPCGSSKDRIAKEMIEGLENNGKLKKGGTIIEPTSGNTGIALAAIAAYKGYKAIIVMPDTMSVERRNLIKAYGANLVLSPGKDGMNGAVKKAQELHENIPGSYIIGQFENEDNPKAHYKTTGPEIWEATNGNIDIFVSAIGTGGTISGTGKYLKEKNSNIKIIGVEPNSSPLLTAGYTGSHKIQGIGANFVPKTLDRTIIDDIITVSDQDAFNNAKLFSNTEGILVGISSGAVLSVAKLLSQKEENYKKTILALLPDSGERYLTTPDFI